MAFDKLRQEWSDMDPKFRWVIIGIVVGGVVLLAAKAMQPSRPAAAETAAKPTAMVDADGQPIDPYKSRLLPPSPRNQGLEVVESDVQGLKDEVSRLKTLVSTLPQPGTQMESTRALYGAKAMPAVAASAPSLDAPLPGPTSANGASAAVPPVDFGQPGIHKATDAKPNDNTADSDPGAGAQPEPPKVEIKVWPADDIKAQAEPTEQGGPVVPVNSAIEAVMLSGVNARPSGATAGAVGSVISANKVGAPFVTRLKGEAMLPNGWKLADLGDCFLGGSAIAVLSTERANVIADTLSCIGKDGEVWEAPIEAYGLDVDGTLGLAGKVVSKQGSLLMQAALTGMASGLGSALQPSALPSYNSNAQSGSTAGVQYPNLGALTQTAVGEGVNHAAAQLSKFYLEYAKEVFPVVEVTAGTRVTWILTKSVELKRRTGPRKTATASLTSAIAAMSGTH
jgi:conjugal transfer pilus assembly protein TraB